MRCGSRESSRNWEGILRCLRPDLDTKVVSYLMRMSMGMRAGRENLDKHREKDGLMSEDKSEGLKEAGSSKANCKG